MKFELSGFEMNRKKLFVLKADEAGHGSKSKARKKIRENDSFSQLFTSESCKNAFPMSFYSLLLKFHDFTK